MASPQHLPAELLAGRRSAKWQAAARSIPRILFGSPMATQGPLQSAHRDIRTPLALARRVGIVQFSGGVGASTLAANVMATLVACRSAKSLAVDAAGGDQSLLARMGRQPIPDESPLPDAVPRPDREGDGGILNLHPRVAGIDLASDHRRRIAAPHADWVARVEPIARFHDLVVTDWGQRPALDDLSAAAKSSHVLVLAVRSERDSLERVAAIVPALRLLEPQPRIMLVASDLSGRGKGADVARISRTLRVPAHVIPFDASRGRNLVTDSASTSLRTRIAIAEVTATIVREAERSLTDASTPAKGARA